MKDIEDSSQYDIRSQMSLEVMHSNTYANHAMAKSSKQMIGAVPKGTVRQTIANRLLGHICYYAYMHKVNPNIFLDFL